MFSDYLYQNCKCNRTSYNLSLVQTVHVWRDLFTVLLLFNFIIILRKLFGLFCRSLDLNDFKFR